MAKEQDKNNAQITFSKPVIAIILLFFAVIGYAAFWKDRGGAEAKAEMATGLVVETLNNRLTTDELRMTVTESDVKEVHKDLEAFKDDVADEFNGVDKRFDSVEKMAERSAANQQALLKGQEALQRGKETDAAFKQQIVKEIADLAGYLKSIESID